VVIPISLIPAVPAGVRTVTAVFVSEVIVAATPPIVTEEVLAKLVPKIVVVVPPATGPVEFEIDEKVGHPATQLST
jgi:hypothetical protein